jgi:hypothetical protein
MKQSFLKFAGKKFITAAFISASLFLVSFNANATSNTPNIEILSNDKPSVEFTGSTPDALVFKVHINNQSADNFTLTIKNNDGAVLFSKSFNDANFEKQIKILKDDEYNNSNRYYFTVSSTNKNLEETYVISAKVQTVDDVTINRL